MAMRTHTKLQEYSNHFLIMACGLSSCRCRKRQNWSAAKASGLRFINLKKENNGYSTTRSRNTNTKEICKHKRAENFMISAKEEKSILYIGWDKKKNTISTLQKKTKAAPELSFWTLIRLPALQSVPKDLKEKENSMQFIAVW